MPKLNVNDVLLMTNGKEFVVYFIKKNNEPRRIKSRLAIETKRKDVVNIYDVDDKGFKRIFINSICAINFDGKVYLFDK